MLTRISEQLEKRRTRDGLQSSCLNIGLRIISLHLQSNEQVNQHEHDEQRIRNNRNEDQRHDHSGRDQENIRVGRGQVTVDLLHVSRQSVQHLSNRVLVEKSVYRSVQKPVCHYRLENCRIDAGKLIITTKYYNLAYLSNYTEPHRANILRTTYP